MSVQSSPPARAINKEAIRVLVLQHGQREAARIAGLNENTVRSWALRYKWSTPTAASKVQPNGHSPLVERISDELAEHERETRLGLAKHTKHAIRAINKSVHPAKWTKEAKDVAQTAAIVHKWDQKSVQANVMVNVALLGVDPGEVQAKVTDVSDTD